MKTPQKVLNQAKATAKATAQTAKATAKVTADTAKATAKLTADTAKATARVTAATAKHALQAFRTRIPARMDRLPWARFHWLVLGALGITWILDGLEVTFTGAIGGVLAHPETLHFSSAEIGMLGSAYVFGAVIGSLVFGYLTDLWGRKRLFFITLAIYLVGVLCSAFSWNIWSFVFFRILTGAGIGGEYAAINSAIDELIPARVRGRVDLIVNGTYWIGAAIGSVSTIFLLDPHRFAINTGWRIGFGAGALLGLGILCLRSFVPESPRWLVLRGRRQEAEEVVSRIEKEIETETGERLPLPTEALLVHPSPGVSLRKMIATLAKDYRRHSILGLVLMLAQAFLFNAIFFTYALVLSTFYHVPPEKTGLYLLPFALGNFFGPLCLGHLFDTIGRRVMISATYGISGVLLAITGYLFAHGYLTATSQTALWTVIFFFASAAASSAYLTVSELFPLETRGLAIAIFYSVGTGIGGIFAPWFFGVLIGTGSKTAIYGGYVFAAVLMLIAAGTEWKLGFDSEGKSLEELATPLGAQALADDSAVATV